MDDYSGVGGAQHGRNVIYVYDDLYRLIGESIDPTPGKPNSGDETDVVYDYDDVGNRTYKVAFQPGLTVIETDYVYDDNDRLLTETATIDGTVAALDRLMGGDARQYADGIRRSKVTASTRTALAL